MTNCFQISFDETLCPANPLAGEPDAENPPARFADPFPYPYLGAIRSGGQKSGRSVPEWWDWSRCDMGVPTVMRVHQWVVKRLGSSASRFASKSELL